ncbi:hypothetical protein E6Q11_04430 [Candidatus Dojkabacteria bacterium]|uniref:Uncharacterized protein n=1 Tax=Candidatus Dojkabacteria bacterium TaxID=2099670 RepID=A0A5C7J4M9_9BACT|nr:MAG: hypothetical protein E6Q11_04430 [Candidatus Dojkabacteria bacterium]
MPKKSPAKLKKLSYKPAVITIAIALGVLFFIGFKQSEGIDKTFVSYGTDVTFQTVERNGIKNKTFENNVKNVMSNTLIKVPGTNQTVSLVNGKADFNEGGASGNIMLGDQFAVVKLGENNFNVLGNVVVNYGGSGDFVYVVLFHATNQLFQYEDFSNVGDRVPVKSLIPVIEGKPINGYKLDVNYLDRGHTAPMSDTPTFKKTLTLEVKDNKFTND